MHSIEMPLHCVFSFFMGLNVLNMNIKDLPPEQVDVLEKYQGNNDADPEESAEKFNHFLTIEYYREMHDPFYEERENERDVRGNYDDKEEDIFLHMKDEMKKIFSPEKREKIPKILYKGINSFDVESHKLKNLGVNDFFVIPCYCSTSFDEYVAECFASKNGLVLEICNESIASFVEMENKPVPFGKAGIRPEAEILLEKKLKFQIKETYTKDSLTYYKVIIVHD